MQIVLLERIEKLGQMGQVVTVKSGFARNFLLPKKKALRATKANLAQFEEQRAHLEATNIKRRDEAGHVAKSLEKVIVSLVRQASESGQLYGSVRTADIALEVGTKGFTVSRAQIELPIPIKTLGLHKARVVLHPEVIVEVAVNVAQSEEEAVIQLAAHAEQAKPKAVPQKEATAAAEEVAEKPVKKAVPKKKDKVVEDEAEAETESVEV